MYKTSHYKAIDSRLPKCELKFLSGRIELSAYVYAQQYFVASEELTDCFDNCNNGKNCPSISLQSVRHVSKAILHSRNEADKFSLLTV